MRDSQKKKRRDLRRAFYSGDGVNLRRLFDKLFPAYSWKRIPDNVCWLEYYQSYENRRREWLVNTVGTRAVAATRHGNASAQFRRSLNRKQRAQDRQILRNAVAHGGIDDVDFPRHHHTANWLWF